MATVGWSDLGKIFTFHFYRILHSSACILSEWGRKYCFWNFRLFSVFWNTCHEHYSSGLTWVIWEIINDSSKLPLYTALEITHCIQEQYLISSSKEVGISWGNCWKLGKTRKTERCFKRTCMCKQLSLWENHHLRWWSSEGGGQEELRTVTQDHYWPEEKMRDEWGLVYGIFIHISMSFYGIINLGQISSYLWRDWSQE